MTSRGAVRAEIERVLIVAVLRRVVAWESASESPGARWRRWAATSVIAELAHPRRHVSAQCKKLMDAGEVRWHATQTEGDWYCEVSGAAHTPESRAAVIELSDYLTRSYREG